MQFISKYRHRRSIYSKVAIIFSEISVPYTQKDLLPHINVMTAFGNEWFIIWTYAISPTNSYSSNNLLLNKNIFSVLGVESKTS